MNLLLRSTETCLIAWVIECPVNLQLISVVRESKDSAPESILENGSVELENACDSCVFDDTMS